MSFEPSAPSSCATARDQLTSDAKRRLLSLRPLPPVAEEEDPGKIAVRAAIVALRLAVSDVDQPRKSTPESTGRRRSIHDLRRMRELRIRRDRDAVVTLTQARPGRRFLPSSKTAMAKKALPYLSKSFSA